MALTLESLLCYRLLSLVIVIHLLLGALSVWIHRLRLNIVDVLFDCLFLLLITRRLLFLCTVTPRRTNINELILLFVLVLGSVVDG